MQPACLATPGASSPETGEHPSPRFQVDHGAARRVAAAFAEAPSSPHDPIVRCAYDELRRQSQRLLAALTDPSADAPLQVVFSRHQEPYATAAELAESVRSDGVLEVGSVAYDHDRRHPLLGHGVGGAHDSFRAVHDLVSHAGFGHDFGRDGEFSAWLAEDRIYRGPARWALATELHAQHSVRWTSGDLAPFKAILLDPATLRFSKRHATAC